MTNSVTARRGCLGRMPGANSRRGFLQQASAGFGWLALQSLVGQTAQVAEAPHLTPRAKSNGEVGRRNSMSRN